MQQMVSPFVMVIFGATGDLTARKLMPALYRLMKQKILPVRFFVVGFGRREITQEAFKSLMAEAVKTYIKTEELDETLLEVLLKNIYYQQGFFENPKPYQELVTLLSSFDKEIGACITRFFYLATPPQNYSDILTHLSRSELAEGCGQGSSKWTRVLIEKPFGKDLHAAKDLEEQLAHVFEERQIYRIDHYLAKETLQNILVFRFANRMFEPSWNKDSIDHVQITLAESGGIDTRGAFYEGVGQLKDMAQNHLMALLAYTTMEEPNSFSADNIRGSRIKALESIREMRESEVEKMVVRGQYEGYRSEKNINPSSNTETFVAFKLFIENDRWKEVPFYLRTGKRMAKNEVHIDIQFKHASGPFFQSLKLPESQQGNVLSIRVQPKEGISLRMFAKTPGLSYGIEPVDMDFSYSQAFKKDITDSYEKILIDTMVADQTLFATSDEFRATWKYVNTIEEVWKTGAPPTFPNYESGSWGPKEADELIRRDGREWILPDLS